MHSTEGFISESVSDTDAFSFTFIFLISDLRRFLLEFSFSFNSWWSEDVFLL